MNRSKRLPNGRTAHQEGALCEYVAMVWLKRQDYLVFTQTTQDLIDIVAVDRNTGETLFIDVKKVYRHAKLTPEQERLGVRLLHVDPYENRCSFEWFSP